LGQRAEVRIASRPDIVLVLTDDQRADTIWAMPTVRTEVVERGVHSPNAFVVNPLCCPSRASILTGKYSYSTGVYRNDPPHGGFEAFDDRSTVATWLQAAGYRTALVGKYLNGYRGKYLPPGWDHWFVTYGGDRYYGYTSNMDGELRTAGEDPSAYSTTVLADDADAFIRSTEPTRPLFLLLAPHAPHDPATPAPGDADAFDDLAEWRPASFDEPDVADKPDHIRKRARFDAATRTEVDRFRMDQHRSLLAVDRAVGQILQALRETGRLAQAFVAFTSDNGMHWGEHRWDTKIVPYEESIRVPFVIRFDAVIDAPRIDERIVLNIDLAPTFAELAGAVTPGCDGQSLVELLRDSTSQWRRDFLVEHLGLNRPQVPTYQAVRTERHVYVRYGTGETELYDLTSDPLQLDNEALDPERDEARATLERRLEELSRPMPRS
jgi:N-acetylglucosamine-6-sulfatase